jgi:pimeloyl-ACP methyl ester carboxylesterase
MPTSARRARAVKAFIAIDELPKSLATAENDGVEADLATWRQFIDGTTYTRREFTREFSRWIVKRDLSAEELDWLVDQSLQTPTSTALLLLIHAMFADYTPEARLMDGRIPVLNVLREERAERAVAWLRANLPNAESFVCKGHMHFWAEPEVFNAALDAFLRKVA